LPALAASPALVCKNAKIQVKDYTSKLLQKWYKIKNYQDRKDMFYLLNSTDLLCPVLSFLHLLP